MTAPFCRISGSCGPFCFCSTSLSASASVSHPAGCESARTEVSEPVPLQLSAAVTVLQEGEPDVVSAELSMAAAD